MFTVTFFTLLFDITQCVWKSHITHMIYIKSLQTENTFNTFSM